MPRKKKLLREERLLRSRRRATGHTARTVMELLECGCIYCMASPSWAQAILQKRAMDREEIGDAFRPGG